MSPLRTLSFCAALALMGLGISSCLTEPSYSDTPEIEFKSIKKTFLNTAGGAYDTVVVTVSFKDGDGDLGLNNDETTFPYSETDASGQPNRFYNNYFFTPQIRNTGTNQFEDLQLGSFNYNSRYPRLAPASQENRKAPLKGDLSFGQRIFASQLIPSGSVIRFKVSIVDRALNESNVVTTEPITID